MRKEFLLIACLFIGLSLADENIRRTRALVLYDNIALLTSHSIFLQDLIGYQLPTFQSNPIRYGLRNNSLRTKLKQLQT